MPIKLEEYFSGFQVAFGAGQGEFALRFPQRLDIYTTQDLWRALGNAWSSWYTVQTTRTPWQLTASWVAIVAELRERVQITEIEDDRIKIEFLLGQQRYTSRDVEYCHILAQGKLSLYDEFGDPSTSLSPDTHLVETHIWMNKFSTRKEFVTSIRWRLENVIRELTAPCRPQDIDD